MSLLSVRGLKVAYGGIHAVRGIDFEVAAGELVCLIGANGAGKSSTLKGLMGLMAHGATFVSTANVMSAWRPTTSSRVASRWCRKVAASSGG